MIGTRKVKKTERDRLIIDHQTLVRNIVLAFTKRLPRHADRDALESDGMLGLVMAADKFDPTRGVKFSTFASPKIRGAILDGLIERDWAPRTVQQRSKRHAEACDAARVRHGLGHDPAPANRSKACRCDTRRDHRRVVLSSLDAPPSHMPDVNVNLGRMIRDRRAPDPYVLSAMRDSIDNMLKPFSRRDRLILKLRHIEDMKQAEIGEAVGLNESRVSQLLIQHHNLLRSSKVAALRKTG